MVRSGFGRRVGARRVVGCCFGKAIGVIELKIAENFVGADVVEALVVLTDCFENGVSADDVRFDKGPWFTQGVIVVTLGGKMHDDISFADEFIHKVVVANVASDELYFIQHRFEVVDIAGIGQLIDDGDLVLWSIGKCVVYKVRPNKPRTARY